MFGLLLCIIAQISPCMITLPRPSESLRMSECTAHRRLLDPTGYSFSMRDTGHTWLPENTDMLKSFITGCDYEMTSSNFSETGQLLQFSFLIQHRVTTTVTSVLFRSCNNTLNSKSQAKRLVVDALEQVKDNCQEDSTPRWGENIKPARQIDHEWL